MSVELAQWLFVGGVALFILLSEVFTERYYRIVDWLSLKVYTFWHSLTCIICKPKSKVSKANNNQRGGIFDGIVLYLGAILIVGLFLTLISMLLGH